MVDDTALLKSTEQELPSSLLWLENILKEIFELKKRKVSIKSEIYSGVVQYFSCIFILPVVSQSLGRAGYNVYDCCTTTLMCMSLGSIVAGLFSNLPFILSPAASIFIFLGFVLRQQNLGELNGNQAVVISGLFLILFFVRPFQRFMVSLIPMCIQASTAVGVGLITALAGCQDVQLIVAGDHSLSALGNLHSAEIQIALAGFVIVGILRYFKVTGAFLIVLIFNTIVYWWQSNTWRSPFASNITDPLQPVLTSPVNFQTRVLTAELLFVYVLILNGTTKGFSEMAGLTNMKKKVVPRVRYIYLFCGVFTVLSGFFGGPPIVISPESGAGIAAGARTGLSSVVAGILFGITTFFTPFWAFLPNAAIAPLLLTLGASSMVNTKKIDFADYKICWPAFIILFFIPFTFDIFDGVILGWLAYLILHLFSGDLYKYSRQYVALFSEDVAFNLFDAFLNNYVPKYWLPAPSEAPSIAIPSSSQSAPTSTPSLVVTSTSESSNTPDIELSMQTTTSRMSAFQVEKPRESMSQIRAVDWKLARQSLWDKIMENDVQDDDSDDEAQGGEHGKTKELPPRYTWA